MRLFDIMSTNLKNISPTETLVKANDIMWRQNIHHLLVMENNELIGLLSDTDLGGDKATQLPDDELVRSRMTTSLTTAPHDMTVKDAVNLMEGHGIHSLPVMKDGDVVGIVTMSDIKRLEKRGDAQPPFLNDKAENDPYLPLQKRNQRGSKAKYGDYSPTTVNQ